VFWPISALRELRTFVDQLSWSANVRSSLTTLPKSVSESRLSEFNVFDENHPPIFLCGDSIIRHRIVHEILFVFRNHEAITGGFANGLWECYGAFPQGGRDSRPQLQKTMPVAAAAVPAFRKSRRVVMTISSIAVFCRRGLPPPGRIGGERKASHGEKQSTPEADQNCIHASSAQTGPLPIP